jgi:cytidylate kinase
VTVLHRSFGDWVTAIDLAGLVLRKVVEPTEAADCGVPRFWLVVAEKPGPTLPIITIDGTAGAGKSTLGRAVADVLGWTFLDTGARARELATRTQMDMPGSPLSDRCGHPDVDATIQAELGVAQRTAAVLVGRGLGRSIAAGLRVWLDAPLGLRARRRGVTPAQLGARDEQDRARGRLLAPDLLALELDGETPAKMLVAQVLDAWERQVARAAR